MRSCFTNRLLLAVNWILPASQPFEMIIPFVSLSAFWRHGGLIIVILLFHPFPVCLCVCLCVALLREWRRQYAGGWIAWFLQQESSTRQVAYRFSFMFVQSFKNAVAVSLLHWPLRTTHTHTHKSESTNIQGAALQIEWISNLIFYSFASKQICKNLILLLCKRILISVTLVTVTWGL